ncbi:MAG: MFS transporter [Alphaproteobacteria bacterium]|nr:MFS transporter [Alphaproteobacteria bacterium]
MNKKRVLSWCIYDWASSAFPTIVMTFVFATYFSEGIAASPEEGAILWGRAMAIAGVILAILAPIFGAIADFAGHRSRWLLFFTVTCALASILLWYAYPDADYLIYGLSMAVIGIVAFEFGMVFYNAYLPEVADKAHYGRVSGWGWGLGYFGGLLALVVALLAFIQTDTPIFGISKENAANVRATFVMVGIWFLLFSIPVFMVLPKLDKPGVGLVRAVPMGINSLWQTLRKLVHQKDILGYLIARMIYTDGLNTLFVFGGIYAAGTFGMDLAAVITFGIALNVTSGLGAFGFAWLDDFMGPKKVLLICLACLSVLGFIATMVTDITHFWIAGLLIGIFLGPVQSASRTMLAHLAPEDLHTEYFGIYALSGKATAFLGPWLLSLSIGMFGTQRAGMAVIIGFFLVGGLLLWRLKLDKYTKAPSS